MPAFWHLFEMHKSDFGQELSAYMNKLIRSYETFVFDAVTYDPNADFALAMNDIYERTLNDEEVINSGVGPQGKPSYTRTGKLRKNSVPKVLVGHKIEYLKKEIKKIDKYSPMGQMLAGINKQVSDHMEGLWYKELVRIMEAPVNGVISDLNCRFSAPTMDDADRKKLQKAFEEVMPKVRSMRTEIEMCLMAIKTGDEVEIETEEEEQATAGASS